MNISGTYKGVNWIGFVRQGAGRRKVFTLKYSMVSGEWRERIAPDEVADEVKFRTWLAQTLDVVLDEGETETTLSNRDGRGEGKAGGAAERQPRKIADAVGEIMTRTEVAELLRCSEPHVLTLVERAGLPAFRLGKLWRFRRSEVLAWCEGGPHGRRSA